MLSETFVWYSSLAICEINWNLQLTVFGTEQCGVVQVNSFCLNRFVSDSHDGECIKSTGNPFFVVTCCNQQWFAVSCSDGRCSLAAARHTIIFHFEWGYLWTRRFIVECCDVSWEKLHSRAWRLISLSHESLVRLSRSKTLFYSLPLSWFSGENMYVQMCQRELQLRNWKFNFTSLALISIWNAMCKATEIEWKCVLFHFECFVSTQRDRLGSVVFMKATQKPQNQMRTFSASITADQKHSRSVCETKNKQTWITKPQNKHFFSERCLNSNFQNN